MRLFLCVVLIGLGGCDCGRPAVGDACTSDCDCSEAAGLGCISGKCEVGDRLWSCSDGG